MAFWGVEVKPGKPFTHVYDDSKGRLHVSMATLGLGSAATAKSTLQCNVGNKSPVYLCSLYPGTTESLQLNLELQEHHHVVFSVIGPSSIHLCGYYLSTPHTIHLDDSESYGEDIADTETDRSDYSDDDEDDYDDSFIDDDADPEVYPPSPISQQEEASQDNIPKHKKGCLRRRKKKYQVISDDEEEKITFNDTMNDEIENEDSLPISSLFNKASAGDASNNNDADAGNTTDPVFVDSQTHREAELSNHLEDPCTVVDVGDAKNFKKKKKRKDQETKSSCNGHSIKLDNGIGGVPKMEKMTQDFVEGINQQQHAEDKWDKETETTDKILPSSQVDHKHGDKPKKKRKERSKEGVHSVATDASHNNLVNLPQSNEHIKQHAVNESGDNNARDVADGNQSEDRKVKKRKKGKSQGNGEAANSDMPVSVEQNGETEMTEDKNKREDTKPSLVKTLPNGLVIQELEKGKDDGKIAATGKKISIYYTGKLKGSEVVFESNAGQAPFKFRLGKGEIMEGWNVGLEGMQVGEKRRLIIPPSLTSESDGHSANIPPNSWRQYSGQTKTSLKITVRQ